MPLDALVGWLVRGGVLIVALLVFLMLPPPAAASAAQWGYAESRNGLTDEGPVFDDVAWRAHVPGSTYYGGSPLVVEGNAYFITGDAGVAPNLTRSALWRADRLTGEVTALVDPLPASQLLGVRGFATDGQRLFVPWLEGVSAYTLDGTLEWEYRDPDRYGRGTQYICNTLAVVRDSLLMGCLHLAGDENQGLPAVGFVARFNAVTGDLIWRRDLDDIAYGSATASKVTALDLDPMMPDASTGSSALISTVEHVSVVGNTVLALVTDVENYAYNDNGTLYNKRIPGEDKGAASAGAVTLWAFELHDGTIRWRDDGKPHAIGRAPGQQTYYSATGDQFEPSPFNHAPTGYGNVGYYVLGRTLKATNLDSGAILWTATLAKDDANPGLVQANMALDVDDQRLYVPTSSAIEVYDISDQTSGKLVAEYTLPRDYEGETWHPMTAVSMTADAIYAMSCLDIGWPTISSPRPTNPFCNLRRLDRATLEETWNVALHDGYANGTLVPLVHLYVDGGQAFTQERNGTVTLWGKSPSSPQPVLEVATSFPPVNASVLLDASASRPGLDPIVAYRANWGDGPEPIWTPWQESPVLEHTYGTAGPHEVWVQVRSASGQTNRASLTLRVGEIDPATIVFAAYTAPELSFLQTAFSRENQDVTFFILGLAVTLAGAVLAALRLSRRHSRLRRELKYLEGIERRHVRTPIQCEQILVQRRNDYPRLVVEQFFDSSQISILEKHIDNSVRRLRVGAFEARLDYLPYRLVRILHSMLQDAQVKRHELEGFVNALRKERGLTPAQKNEVRSLVESWFQRDEVGASTTA